MPFVDLNGLNRFLGKVKTLIDTKTANLTAPTPWRYQYDASGDVLAMVRDTDVYTTTRKDLPYKVSASVDIADVAKAYNDTTNAEYASMPTANEERTLKILIDTQVPPGAAISNMNISFKIGSNNISPSIWTKRIYSVKCGSNELANDTLTLRTMGSIFSFSVSDKSLIVSPVIEISVTVKTTEEQIVRIFGAQVETTFTATQEWVTIMRQNQLAKQ